MSTLGKRILRIVILLSAVACLTAGVLTHGFNDVRSKGTKICMECMGIG